MAFVLALNNRGFSEIGINGLKAQDMTETAQQAAFRSSEASLLALEAAIRRVERSAGKSIEELKEQLDAIETE